MPVENVVERSGVARTTIYRHWPTRLELLHSTFERGIPVVPEPKPGMSFIEAATAVIDSMVDMGRDDTWRRTLPSRLGAAISEPGLAALQEGAVSKQERALYAVLQLGIDEGALPADLDMNGALL